MKLPALLLVLAAFASGQIQIDPAIAAEIAKIKAIDNHAHPVLPAPGDTGYDALPVEHMDPYTEPVRTRAGISPAAEASRQLFGSMPQPGRIAQEREGYPNWVLDQLGIETMLANRIAMGPGIAPPRFLWVPFEDALLFPLDNRALAINSDRKAFFDDESRLLAQYLKACGYTKPPASLGEYLQKIVDPTLERQKRGGAVAVKFEAAYLRSLDFDDVSRAEADAAYVHKASYKKLQDFLFRHIS
ncbi:MAG: amidohydrolase, partial [Bryobacteraceae bacterium]